MGKGSRQSALAKEHGISAATETSIKGVYQEFATAKDCLPSTSFKRALTALNIAPDSKSEFRDLLSAADPEDDGEIPYANFVAVAALKINAQGADDRRQEIEDAFQLFLSMGGSGLAGRAAQEEGKINYATLKRVAALLKDEIKEDALRDMILEANGGAGVEKGVTLDEFEEVMKRGREFL